MNLWNCRTMKNGSKHQRKDTKEEILLRWRILLIWKLRKTKKSLKEKPTLLIQNKKLPRLQKSRTI